MSVWVESNEEQWVGTGTLWDGCFPNMPLMPPGLAAMAVIEAEKRW